MGEVHGGGCLCGAVRFAAKGPLRGVVYCHCSQCRRQSGHYYAATNVADADLTVEGAQNLTWFAASEFARRGFCATCGSALFWKHNEVAETSVMAGAFDRPSGLKSESHIFVVDKGDYYTIDEHARIPDMLIMSQDVYDSLSEDEIRQIEEDRARTEEAAKLREEDYQLAYAIDILKGLSALGSK